MRQNQTRNNDLLYNYDYDNETITNYDNPFNQEGNYQPIEPEIIKPYIENPIYQGGNSQVIEPEIINIIKSEEKPPVKSTIVLEDIKNIPKDKSPIIDNQSNNESDIKGEPSATTNETKTYVGGGTSPDSKIVIKKPKINYILFGIIGVIGAFAIYKLFINKTKQ